MNSLGLGLIILSFTLAFFFDFGEFPRQPHATYLCCDAKASRSVFGAGI